VGKKVCSVGISRDSPCHHTSLIPGLHILAEIKPTCAHPTGSYCPCVGKLAVDGKHTALLFNTGIVVQVNGDSREARIVVDGNGIRQIRFGAKVATGSQDNSGREMNPFVQL